MKIKVEFLDETDRPFFNITSLQLIKSLQQLPLKFSNKQRSRLKLPSDPKESKEVNDFICKTLHEYNNQLVKKNHVSCDNLLKFWQMILSKTESGVIINKHPLIHPTFIKDQYNNTVAMILAQKGIVIPQWWKHNIHLQNMFGDTVATIYARCGFIPPQEWCQTRDQPKHIQIRNPIDGRSCMMLYILHYLKTQFQEVKDRLSPEQRTKEIIKVYEHIPSYCHHSSLYKDYNDQTIAHTLSQYGIIPPKTFLHDPNRFDKFYKTVSCYLIENQIKVPKEWIAKTNQRFTSEFKTQAMIYFESNEHGKKALMNPKHCFTHNPSIQDCNGLTIAMRYAQQGIIPPEHWKHDPTLKANCGYTVFDFLKFHFTQNTIYQIPSYWRDYQNEPDFSVTSSMIYTPITSTINSMNQIDYQYSKIIDRYHNINDVMQSSSYDQYNQCLINSSPISKQQTTKTQCQNQYKPNHHMTAHQLLEEVNDDQKQNNISNKKNYRK